MVAFVVRGLIRGADWVSGIAPITHDVCVRLEIRELRLVAWEEAIDAGAAAPVVALVGVVTGVAEDHYGSD